VRDVELTTVTDTEAVLHDGLGVARIEDLEGDREYERHGISFRTMPRPGGALLSRVAMVNDVHFGEQECGRIDDHLEGPIQRVAPGEVPYPETMNRGAVAEIGAAAVDAVVVRGDLTSTGTDEEFAAFEACYGSAFGERLHTVRGNHDAYLGQQRYSGDRRVVVPGLIIALLDTVTPRETNGSLTADQFDWLDDLATSADRPVIVMGHHPQWTDGRRSPDYFGLNPDDSDRLTALIARRSSVVAYSAGHTHRHRVRRLASGVPTIEIGCVKDFPGSWGELRVYEGGLLHVVHRISTPDALAWSERCRFLYRDFGVDYQAYALGRLEDRCFPIHWRD
jgi:predicted phosphodiesterase